MASIQDYSESEALKRVPLFASLDRHDLEAVERISRAVEFAPGSILIDENEAGHHFFVVLNGELSVQRDGAEINRMGVGDFFGEISLLSNRPTTASVVTITPVRVLMVAPAAFKQLLEELPSMQMKVIEALAARLPDEFYWAG
jgi:CRP-like cAMP-binding protein